MVFSTFYYYFRRRHARITDGLGRTEHKRVHSKTVCRAASGNWLQHATSISTSRTLAHAPHRPHRHRRRRARSSTAGHLSGGDSLSLSLARSIILRPSRTHVAPRARSQCSVCSLHCVYRRATRWVWSHCPGVAPLEDSVYILIYG